jgi:hypothetical protein
MRLLTRLILNDFALKMTVHPTVTTRADRGQNVTEIYLPAAQNVKESQGKVAWFPEGSYPV